MLTSSSLPRWLLPRAARLGASVVESVLEVHGHQRLLERLADVRFGRTLAAALALPDENDLGAVARVLQRGLAHDAGRLGLVVDPAAGVVALADGTLSPLFCVDGVRVVQLHSVRLHGGERHGAGLRNRRGGQRPLDVEQKLGAALLVAHAPRPFTSEPLGRRAPGRGPRELFALALFADLVVSGEPSPELMRLALGSATGDPFGVPLLIYDDVLGSFERLLHRPAGRRGFRLSPLLALHEELGHAERRATRQSVERFVRRELRFARDLDSRTRDDDAAPRPLPRRPAREARRPLSWRPALPASTNGRGQRDLFAP